ncbi:hypothetical protein K466DRAFT_183453 [Polyporus arcularius HHB13444]|uniref:T6SS Phospholipase effector Tle1-like catalytic domain-containing protein n=1 Tax=Polyporus arcularius HHB13444 TaxID=1314778 RepID=A0A5C3P7A9_9APHY|nr:hypothetical protein K466DRAFT_183453 [Polyporus arcularius HHB13444]
MQPTSTSNDTSQGGVAFESPPSTATLASSSAYGSFSAAAARTLVLCFDGTGDCFDADNSNVVSLFSMLKKGDRNEQMVYYQPGIGTYLSNTQNVNGIKARIDKVLDEAIAWDLDAHVMGGYEFLMQNYQAGDKISLFGFSRGAYTARALAGMLHKVGLLPPCNHQQVPFAYKMYTMDDAEGWVQSNAFKKAFCIDVSIDFIGVWDTVGSVGVIPHSSLPFVQSNDAIRVFRHALALDERRVRFKPALYRHTAPEDVHGINPGDMPKGDTTWAFADKLEPLLAQLYGGKPHRSASGDQFCKDHGGSHAPGKTDTLEVWFAGCHCDVGGGSVKDSTPFKLARIPLRWMVRECIKANTGIRFHAELIKNFGLDPATLNALKRPDAIEPEVHHLRPDVAPAPEWTEETHEVHDALAQVYDQLAIKWYQWWPLEWFPTRAEDGIVLWPNMGRGRDIPTDHKPFYVHRSVKMRMAASWLKGWQHGPYKPKPDADWARGPVWVD